MRRNTAVSIIVHYPKTDEGKCELSKRVATVHAEAASAYIETLPYPAAQKITLARAAASP